MLPSDKSAGEADVSAAIIEIKMSVTHSCRASEEKHKHSPERAKVKSVCVSECVSFLGYELVQTHPHHNSDSFT